MDLEKLVALGKECGFSHVAFLDVDTVKLIPEVRAMCEANTCRMYGKNWACPPGVGALEECESRIRQYKKGIIVQTVGELEDAMDGEGMMEAEENHKEHFDMMQEKLYEMYPDMLAVGAGTCTRCKKCTYPDQPCRFPKKRFASMESYGMLVSEVCKANNLPYYYGPNTIAYTSCFLIV